MTASCSFFTAPKEEKTTSAPLSSPDEILDMIRDGNLSAVQSTLDALAKLDQLSSLVTITDDKNNTILHLALSSNEPGIAECIVNKLGFHAIALCKHVNSKGQIPLRLTSFIFDSDSKTKLEHLILPKTLDCSIKKISQPLDEEEVIKHNPEALKNPALMQNLTLGCQAISLSRKEAPESLSHPQFNEYSPEKKLEIVSKTYTLRKNLTGPSTDLKDTQAVHKKTNIIKTAGVANCGEYSLLTHSHLMDLTKDNPTRLEIAHIINGDHAFNIIGRKENSNINDPATWGDSAVVADTWSGNVYPATQLFSQLHTYEIISPDDAGISARYNICPLYNTKYHSLEPVTVFEHPISQNFVQPYINTPTDFSRLLFGFQDKTSVQSAIDNLSSDQLKKLITPHSQFCLFKDTLPSKDKWKADVVLESCQTLLKI